jgi:hypothetical protein
MENTNKINRGKRYREGIKKKGPPRELGIANSVSGFIDKITKNVSGFYRGQRKDDKLIPKIFRIKKDERQRYLKGNELLNYEKNLLKKFKNRARAFLKDEPKNELEWLAVAHHFGLYTRLLDWTENALVALWFCVEKGVPELNDSKEENGVVYRFWRKKNFNPEVTEDDMDNPFDIKFTNNIKLTKIYHPPHISDRIIAQSSVFTVHNYDTDKDIVVPMEEEEDISKIIIPYDSFKNIKKELLNCGIHSAFIYPDINGKCNLINFEFENEKEKIKNIIEYDKNFSNKTKTIRINNPPYA